MCVGVAGPHRAHRPSRGEPRTAGCHQTTVTPHPHYYDPDARHQNPARRRKWQPTPARSGSPWTGDPGGLRSTGSQRGGRVWAHSTHCPRRCAQHWREPPFQHHPFQHSAHSWERRDSIIPAGQEVGGGGAQSHQLLRTQGGPSSNRGPLATAPHLHALPLGVCPQAPSPASSAPGPPAAEDTGWSKLKPRPSGHCPPPPRPPSRCLPAGTQSGQLCPWARTCCFVPGSRRNPVRPALPLGTHLPLRPQVP